MSQKHAVIVTGDPGPGLLLSEDYFPFGEFQVTFAEVQIRIFESSLVMTLMLELKKLGFIEGDQLRKIYHHSDTTEIGRIAGSRLLKEIVDEFDGLTDKYDPLPERWLVVSKGLWDSQLVSHKPFLMTEFPGLRIFLSEWQQVEAYGVRGDQLVGLSELIELAD